MNSAFRISATLFTLIFMSVNLRFHDLFLCPVFVVPSVKNSSFSVFMRSIVHEPSQNRHTAEHANQSFPKGCSMKDCPRGLARFVLFLAVRLFVPVIPEPDYTDKQQTDTPAQRLIKSAVRECLYRSGSFFINECNQQTNQ